jgi:hypothetical protein
MSATIRHLVVYGTSRSDSRLTLPHIPSGDRLRR